ncbi:hypothetical protein ACRRTK_023299 [Alexandromys fortis]
MILSIKMDTHSFASLYLGVLDNTYICSSYQPQPCETWLRTRGEESCLASLNPGNCTY